MRTAAADELLARAHDHCFMSGVGDAGESLCAANQPYGLAKIHWVQDKLGIRPDATFVGAPDATVTRNESRWRQGFGYGGRLRWSGDLAVLDVKSNACGMMVAALPEVPDQRVITERALRVRRDGLEVDGVEIEYDLDEGNHFLDICETRSAPADMAASPCYAVLHSSGHEHRKSSTYGPYGIYYDESEELARASALENTPWGTLSILSGSDALAFYDLFDRVQRFALARREALMRALLGPIEIVCNRTHQGIEGVGDAVLGCYAVRPGDIERGQLFPLTLSPELPVYLVAPRPSFGPDVLEATGFGERAAALGVLERVAEANLLPHGGGYRYAEWAGVARVMADGPDRRRFEMNRTDGGTDTIDTPRKSKHGYRGDEVRTRMLELGLGDPIVSTEIRYILRTDHA